MDDAFLMHVLQAIADLLDDGRSFPFREFSLLLDLLETAIWEGLDDEI